MKVKQKTKKVKKVEKVGNKNEDNSAEQEMEVDSAQADPILSNEMIIDAMQQANDSESSDEEEPSPKKNAKKSNEKEPQQQEEKKLAYDKEDEPRTVFCGNIPNSENLGKSRVRELFSQYGTVKSLRLRSDTGNVLFAKKNKKNCSSLIAYVVFKNEEDAKKSCQLNGYKLLENHLRVNMANDKKEAFNNKGTIFVGNLTFDATEEEVHDFFGQAGEIEYVRIIPKKGIAYVCFKKGVNLIKALKFNDQEFKGRKLRVSRCESRDKQDRKKLFKRDEKTGRVVKQRVKKSHKLNDSFIKGRPNINNPIIKKIKESQKAKFNKFTGSDQVSKKDIFRRGGKTEKDSRDANRDKFKKKQKFFGSKVDDGTGSNKKSKKTKVSKTAKQQKVFAKKLKSAAVRSSGK
jgi:nucleolar protein 12